MDDGSNRARRHSIQVMPENDRNSMRPEASAYPEACGRYRNEFERTGEILDSQEQYANSC